MQIFVDILLLLIYFSLFFLILTYIWTFWKMYVTQKSFSKMNEDSILLEIKLPREITKSPESIELIVNSFQQIGGVGPWYNRNWKGALSSFFSFEIASIEGDVKFFVRTEKKYKEMITSNFYSQYDGIEIVEADDYVKLMYLDHRGKSVSMVGADHKLAEKFKLNRNIKRDKDVKDKDPKKEDEKLEMPADYKMIKTYVDYKLDKDPKEEFKHDPLTPILEWMGSLKKGQHAWYQVILQEVTRFDGDKFPKTYYNKETDEYFNLKELAEERIKQIRKRLVKKITTTEVVKNEYGYELTMKNPKFKMIKDPNDATKMISNGEEEYIPTKYADSVFSDEEKKAGYKYVDEKDKKSTDMDLTADEKDEIEMINRKLSKPLFRALVRTIYIAEDDKANFLPNLYSMYNTMRAFKGANGFFPFRNADPYDYPWQDVGKKRKPWRREEIFESYVEREAFYPHIPFRDKSPNKFMEFLYPDGGIDAYLDGKFFEKSLGYRKIFRLLYEGFLHPFSHPHPNICTLNAEEVATIWHLPGSVASTPGIKRVDSLKSDAPTNLPR